MCPACSIMAIRIKAGRKPANRRASAAYLLSRAPATYTTRGANRASPSHKGGCRPGLMPATTAAMAAGSCRARRATSAARNPGRHRRPNNGSLYQASRNARSPCRRSRAARAASCAARRARAAGSTNPGCAASSTSAATRSACRAAHARATRPPKEYPTSTTGPRAGRRASSQAVQDAYEGASPRGSRPCPGRSGAHTRAGQGPKRAQACNTAVQSAAVPKKPCSKTQTGRPVRSGSPRFKTE